MPYPVINYRASTRNSVRLQWKSTLVEPEKTDSKYYRIATTGKVYQEKFNENTIEIFQLRPYINYQVRLAAVNCCGRSDYEVYYLYSFGILTQMKIDGRWSDVEHWVLSKKRNDSK